MELNPAFVPILNNMITNIQNKPITISQNLNIHEIQNLIQQLPKAQQPVEKKATTHNKFTPDDDEKLKKLVVQLGNGQWRQIASIMGDRTARQCRDRWKNYLMPGVNTAPWSEYEDKLLDQKVNELGRKWSVIAKFFPGRTDINIKNRYASHTTKKFKDDEMLKPTVEQLAQQRAQ